MQIQEEAEIVLGVDSMCAPKEKMCEIAVGRCYSSSLGRISTL